MFWGLVLEPSKKYTQKVDLTFHISQAALDLKSCDMEPIQLVVEYENASFVLCTLSKKSNIYQVPLDLIFKTGDQVSFRTIGSGKVHLSGYHVLEYLDKDLLNGEEESDLEELEVEEVKGKRKKSPSKVGGKKMKMGYTNEEEIGSDEEDEDESEEEEEESDEEKEKTSPGKKGNKKKGKQNLSLLNMDDDDDDDDDDDEDDDDYEGGDSDEEIEGEEDEDEDDEDEEDLDDLEMDESEEEFVKTPKSASKKQAQTPNGVVSSTQGADKSSQKPNKKQGTPGKESKTQMNESKKGEKNLKNAENKATPQKNSQNAKNGDKTPKSSSKGEGSPQKKVLEGGVIAEELKVGDGPMAKPGKLASVYYVGTLAANKKQFDAVQNGPAFKFRIGRNEVIKGWDIGINGMKVGGKRRLTIPPHFAYGSKGSPPVIPPNSTLIFTVELKGLS